MRFSNITRAVCCAVLILLGSAPAARADLTRIAGPTTIADVGNLFVKFDVAFDSNQGVYLVVWGTQPPVQTWGRFVDVNGAAIGNPFLIAELAGWARVVYGGGKFLVSFTNILGPATHQRAVRFVTHTAGTSPSVSAQIPIATWSGGAATDSGMAYSNGRFLVTWWNFDANPPQSYVAILDPNGSVLVPGVHVSRLGDGQTDPEIACDSARGRCLIVGQAWGVFSANGNTPGTWARLISDSTGQPVTDPFFVAFGAVQKESTITFSPTADRFLVAFSRGQNSIWAATVGAANLDVATDYQLRAPNEDPGDGGGYGRPLLSYNPSTGSVILAMKPWIARTAVMELTGSGSIVPGTFQMTPAVVHWSQGTQEIAATSDTLNSRFLVADNQGFRTMRASLYSGTGGSSPPPPPPPPQSCSYSLSSTSQAFGAFGGVGGFTLTTGPSCSWSTTSNAGWLAATSSNTAGAGGKTISYTVTTNSTSSARVGVITVGGQSFTVTQAGLALDAFTARERGRADVNQDGHADILLRHGSTGQLAVWMLNGTSVGVEAGFSHSMPDTNWEIAGTGDFNSDGKPDILWRHKLYGFVAVWFMNGTTNFGAVSLSIPQVDISWKIGAVGDFNLDGHTDIIWQHDSGQVVMWAMQGVQVVWGAVLPGDPAMAADARWRIAGAADLNYDGHMDLLWRHENGWLATWLMLRSNVWQVHSLDPVGEFDTSWRVVGTLDVNRDGRYDILWQHTDGTIMVWAMDGLTRVYNAIVTGGSIGGPSWKVVGPK